MSGVRVRVCCSVCDKEELRLPGSGLGSDCSRCGSHPDRKHVVGNEWAPAEGFKKADGGKLRWTLMPWAALEDVVRGFMHGADRYGVDNWKSCPPGGPDGRDRFRDALLRHVTAYTKGEKLDVGEGGSGLPHLALAVCCALILMSLEKEAP